MKKHTLTGAAVGTWWYDEVGTAGAAAGVVALEGSCHLSSSIFRLHRCHQFYQLTVVAG